LFKLICIIATGTEQTTVRRFAQIKQIFLPSSRYRYGYPNHWWLYKFL